MPVQKQHKTKGRRDRRRVMHKIKAKQTEACPKCSKQKLSHQACMYCGYYKGKEVVNTLKKVSKKTAAK